MTSTPTGERALQTRAGLIPFPAYIPVTTFGDRYPLDNLVRPYLPRLASAVMVSAHYAKQMTERPRLPILVDSGGFASLFEGATVVDRNGLGVLQITREGSTEATCPADVLDLQEEMADVGFTLDFPVPPGMDSAEAEMRQGLTIANAHWALANRRRSDLPLYACIQAWDVPSARRCARSYASAGFDGVAIGGMVPRARDRELVLSILRSVREEVGGLPVHVFGLGSPDMVAELFKARADSVDSSSYVQLAAEGRMWGDCGRSRAEPSPTDRLHLALCNLASATARALPLSAFPVAFRTAALAAPATAPSGA